MKKITIKLSAEELKKKMNLKDGYTPVKGKDYFDGKSGKPGKDGKSIKGDKGDPADPVDTFKIASDASKLAYNELLPKIPTILQIEQDLPILGEPIRDSLELLQGDDRLDSSAVKGLDKMHKDTLDRAVSILDQRTKFLINKKTSTTDEKLKISSNDTITGYLEDKIVAGFGITLTKQNTGANENIRISTPSLLEGPVEDWWDPVAEGGLPPAPTLGDRYIAETSGSDWTEYYIYEWDGDEWVEYAPEEGWMVWMLMELVFYVFFSGGWMEVGSRTFVPYEGAIYDVDLGNKNITTTGTVKGSNIIDGVGVAKITVGTTEPTSPATGDLWLDTN